MANNYYHRKSCEKKHFKDIKIFLKKKKREDGKKFEKEILLKKKSKKASVTS